MTSILPEAGPSHAASSVAALRPYAQRCKLCGAENDAAPVAICENCLGPLEPLYPVSRRLPDRATIAARPQSLWRYREWLPFEGDPVASLDTGFTPLIDAPRLADKLGVARVWVKNDAVSSLAVVQGSRRLHGHQRRTGVRARHGGLRVHRQSRQRGRGTRGARGTDVVDLH